MFACSPLVARASTLIAMHRHVQAEQLLRQAIAADPADHDAFTLLADCLRLQQRHDEAVTAATEAVSLAPEIASTHVSRAYALKGAGRDHHAYEAAREAARLDPHATASLAALAECSMPVDLADAEAAARALQRVAPDHFIGHHLMARVAMNRGHWADAERWSRESLRCHPVSSAEHANLALTLDKLGRTEEAAWHHREAVRLDPRRDTPRGNLHIALRIGEERGDGSGAPYTAADVAGTLNPEQRARTLTNVVHHALVDGRIAHARAAADEIRSILDALPLDTVEARRVHVLASEAMMRVDSRAGDVERVCESLSALRDEAFQVLRANELRVFLGNLGIAQMRAGSPDAVATLGELVAMERRVGSPDGLGRALLNLGAAHAGSGDDARAAACYQECAATAAANGHTARHATAALNLARVSLRARRLDEARRLLDQAEPVLGAASPLLRANASVVRGGIALREGALEAARAALLQGLWTLRVAGDRLAVDGFAYLAEVEAGRGRHRIAALHLATAQRRAFTVDTRRTVAAARQAVEAGSVAATGP